MSKPDRTVGEKLQSLPKSVLYLILVLATSIPLIYGELTHGTIAVPNRPFPEAEDFYATLMKIPEGKTILLESDWTNSTRGESGGEFEAVMKIAMDRKLKVAILTTADPQAPRVASDTITALNTLRQLNGLRPFERWNDWVNLGYFPNAEGTLNSMSSNIRKVFAGKKDVRPDGVAADVLTSPVLKGMTGNIGDFPVFVVCTASKTSTITIERLNGKVPLAFMVTGVMGPETQVYYTSGQLVGMINGLKGVYDLETMMSNGVKGSAKNGDIPAVAGTMSRGKGTAYYPTLHVALTLLILAVATGNIGMFLSRRKS